MRFLIHLLCFHFLLSNQITAQEVVHVWEKQELTFVAREKYENPYTEVEVWVELKGPGFHRRCYGFWDGENLFKVRIVATAPGQWSWESGSNCSDRGLTGQSGSFMAIEWTEKEKEEVATRRGYIQAFRKWTRL